MGEWPKPYANPEVGSERKRLITSASLPCSMTCEARDPPVDLTGPDLEAASCGS